MILRPMEMKDYQQVYALWLACPGMGLNDLDDSPEGIRRFLQRNPETCFVAAEGETIAGCILVGTDGRRGLGRQLVERALESLRQMGIHKTALVVFARNQQGNAFWERMGFTLRTDILYRNRALTEMTRIDT